MKQDDSGERFEGPHQGGDLREAGTSPEKARAAAILIHGRGASAESILALGEGLDRPELYLVAPQAYRSTWYPYSFLYPVEENQPELDSALQVIRDLFDLLADRGFKQECILLGGFSQGACLAAEFAARNPSRYGGIFCLSGGLIGQTVDHDRYLGDLKGTPVFIGCSDVDSHIPLDRVHETTSVFRRLGASVTERIYPGMAHTINSDEMDQVRKMVSSLPGECGQAE